MKDLEVKEVDIGYWNELSKEKEEERKGDILSVARVGEDRCFQCGGFLVLLQGVGELNNFCIQRESNDRENVVEVVRSVLSYLFAELNIKVVTIIIGHCHKRYDALYRYFLSENISECNGIYFIDLNKKEWINA